MSSKWNERDEEPKIKFYKECIKNGGVALPIMTKIFDRILMIRNTKLNEALVKAI